MKTLLGEGLGGHEFVSPIMASDTSMIKVGVTAGYINLTEFGLIWGYVLYSDIFCE